MANLTPEQLARIQAYYAPQGGSGWSPSQQSPFIDNGRVYQQQDGFIYSYDPNKQQAGQDQFDVYNADGTFSNAGTFKTDDWQKTLLMALAAAGGMSMLGAGAAGANAGYGAMGATEPIASIGASGGMTASELAAMGAGGSGLGTMAPLATIEGPMSSSLLADSLTTMGGAGAGAGGLAGALGGAAKYLGPAATLLGGLAGAQGQKTEQTSERKTDPRVDPYLFGANGQLGLLQMTYDKLVGQMKPGGLPGYDDMQRVGMGLLNAPVAGNGFGLFTKGKY